MEDTTAGDDAPILPVMTLASTLPLAAACLVLLPGCGARSNLESASTASACEGPAPSGPPAQCSGWQLAGPIATVSAGSVNDVESMIPSAGGALVAWSTEDGATAGWSTRAVGFDGTPRAAVSAPLPTFVVPVGEFAETVSLAGQGCAFGGLGHDSVDGCHFVPLDENGAAAGPVVTLQGPSAACTGLGPAQGGYSFLRNSISSDTGPIDLVSLDAAGSVLATRSLLFEGELNGGRLVLPDRSFLLSTQDGAGEDLMQRFSSAGTPIAAAAQITSGPVLNPLVAATSAGAMVGWGALGAGSGGVFLRPLDEDGHPVAAEALVAATVQEDLFGFTLAGTPAGDVLLAWFDLDETMQYDLHVMAVGPDGAPRGAPASLGTFQTLVDVHALVEADGRRALIVITGAQVDADAAVLAVPLACAP